MAGVELIIGVVIALIAGASAGVAAGFALKQRIGSKRLHELEERLQDAYAEASTQQKEMLLEAKEEAVKIRHAAQAEIRERQTELQRQERRLTQKEENLDRKLDQLERREQRHSDREREIDQIRSQVDELRHGQTRELERVSGMTQTEARDYLLKQVEGEVRAEASRRAREIIEETKEEAERRAHKIVSLAIQRLASDVVQESTVTSVPLPNEEMKGRIIGREGRNIRAIEAATGVDIIIDETPDAVTISGFDPVRRQVAKLALVKLFEDGRIHPARIEEAVERAKREVEAIMREQAEAAAYEAGVHGLHPEIMKLLGRLRFRYSYGQNVLWHSVEVARLAAMMASEMGGDVEACRVGGLLHDIGKAVDHEVEGGHAVIGGDIGRRYIKNPKVISGIAAHHGDEEPTVESFLVSAADAISGGRPGARRDSLEQYIKRLEAIESIAMSFPGVERSFAVQAGREVRILVKPDEIDDLGSIRLARDLAKRIEDSLEYPGQIKITVMRETRAVEFAK